MNILQLSGGRLIASFLCLSAIFPFFSARASKQEGTFASPNFEFPKTVEKNALPRFNKAMKSGDGITAIKAAIQLDIARNRVSSDKYQESIELFDSIANVMPVPYNALALLLEAKLYKDIYNSKRGDFDRRLLPDEPIPDNVMHWNRKMFDRKVSGLVERALSYSEQCRDIPLSKISDLLVDCDDAVKAGFSVADFMTLVSIPLVNTFNNTTGEVIPFGKTSAKGDEEISALKLIDEAISRHEGDNDKISLWFFMHEKLEMLNNSDEEEKYLEKCYETFKDTRYGGGFLVDWCYKQFPDDPAKRLELLTAYQKRFPKAFEAGTVQRAIDQLLCVNLEMSVQNKMLPDVPNKISVSGKNLYDFNILIYKMPSKKIDDDSVLFKDLAALGKPTAVVPVHVDSSSPATFDTDVELPALEPGFYAFLFSKTADLEGCLRKEEKAKLTTSLVSNVAVIVSKSDKDEITDFFVVSARNQQPLKDATVTLYKSKGNGKEVVKELKSDSNGKVSIPKGSYYYRAEANGNIAEGYIYANYGTKEKKEEVLNVKILTDLSIYHPGDQVQFAAIAYYSCGNELKLAPDCNMSFILQDANRENVGMLNLTTDENGRVSGEFTLPKDGLLGSWSIFADKCDRWRNEVSFTVAEYKAPTFHVDLEAASECYKVGEDILFKGFAQNYNGLPVGEGKVSYSVSYQPFWWRSPSAGASYGGETITLPDGTFSINLSTENLKDTKYATGSYCLNVSVTNPAGETVDAKSVRFSLGSAYRIMSGLPELLNVDSGEIERAVTLYDASMHPLQKTIYYELRNADKALASGEFMSPSFKLNVENIPSGKYNIRFALSPEMKSTPDCNVVSDSITIWRTTDKVPPVTTPLWLPLTQINAPKDSKKVKIQVGTSYPDSWILAQCCTDETLLDSQWVKINDGIAEFEIDVPGKLNRTFVTFAGMHDYDVARQTVTVIPFTQTERLCIVPETFRDKIVPGATESWKFRFKVGDNIANSLPVMAVMSNKALNALEPFHWYFDPFNGIYRRQVGSLEMPYVCQESSSVVLYVNNSRIEDGNFETPEWETYGYPLYSGMQRMMYNRMLGACSVKDMAMPTTSAVVESDNLSKSIDLAESESAAGADEASLDAAESASPDIELREVDCPLAFFKPDLTTDAEGAVTLEFEAPAFVGTWQLQVLGYNDELHGNVLTLDAVSAKAVMAQINAPRFLRTGDKASISASLYNNTPDALPISGRIELVDAITGKIVVAKDFAQEEVAPSASRLVTSYFDVPSDVEALYARVYAISSEGTDGEQTLVPVYPSSAPLTESDPFYMAPGDTNLTLNLPDFKDDAQVTLSFCDNPVWECVTALPEMIQDESVNLLSQAYVLYGNALANYLFGKYPRLMEGIREMASPENASDSSLYSALQKNQNLKIFLLNNTPWVNDARSETLRMQSLVKYADAEAARRSIDDAMKNLVKSQQSDGGWSWCPEMKSSEFITMRVLDVLASLKEYDCLPEGGEDVVKKAFKFMDASLVKSWVESNRKYIPTLTMLDYLLDRSLFDNVSSTSEFKAMENASMKEIEKGWSDFSIYNRASTAILLQRVGKKQSARLIIESLRQLASESKEKGMWYDNLSGAYSGDMPVMSTARVLQAFSLIEPGSPEIDKFRQWLVLTKHLQNWGDSRSTVAAITALLTCGSDWTESSQLPVVKLNGREVPLDKVASVTGAFTLDLPVESSSEGRLEIIRDDKGPAWGGVISRFILPILDVKTDKIPQLSIEKNVYAVNQTENGPSVTAGDFKVGDRVRVTLTVICDADMDYVAINDARSACLEPVNQISGYTASDGVWFYREVRNEATNLFIPYLPKGTHVISYECNVDRAGTYSLGIASAQSQYAPTIAAHSAGHLITSSNQ